MSKNQEILVKECVFLKSHSPQIRSLCIMEYPGVCQQRAGHSLGENEIEKNEENDLVFVF